MKITKLILATLVILLLAFPAYAADTPVIDAQVAIRHANLERMHLNIALLGEGFVNYINEIGGDTTELNNILDDFDAKLDDLLSADTHKEINDEMTATRTIVEDFKREYDVQFAANNGKEGMGIVRALDNVKAHKDEVDAKEENYWSVRLDQTSIILDTQIQRGEDTIDFFEKRGQDTSALRSNLDDIIAKEADLLSAIQAKKPVEAAAIQLQIGILGNSFVEEADRLLHQ